MLKLLYSQNIVFLMLIFSVFNQSADFEDSKEKYQNFDDWGYTLHFFWYASFYVYKFQILCYKF